MEPKRLLLTGASGYIGGSILSAILQSSYPNLQRDRLEISALVRSEGQATKLKELGIIPIIFKDLDDSEALIKAASGSDVVIHATMGFHPPSGKALIEGLHKRKLETGKDTYYVHTAGTSNLADYPVTKSYSRPPLPATSSGSASTSDFEFEFSDKSHPIYDYQANFESIRNYPQRTATQLAIDTGLQLGVKTYVVMSPTIYGEGSGVFNRRSIQIPGLIKASLSFAEGDKKSFYIGKGGYNGTGCWDYVHIEDVSNLYTLILSKALDPESNIPFGKEGIYFSATGRYTWIELGKLSGKAGFELGYLDDKEPKEIDLEEGTKLLDFGDKETIELNFTSNSRTRSELAADVLGWKPTKTQKDWEDHFTPEFKFVAESINAKQRK